MKKTIIFLLLFIIILLVGCQQKTSEVVCNEPYILVGTDCCLDEDSNKICDNDETSQEGLKGTMVNKDSSEEENFLEKPKEVIPWEEFLEECSSQFAKTIFLSNKNYYTDKCEKEYAKEFNLPEYCEKIDDRDESENCWLALALQNNDVIICTNLKASGTSADSPYQSCKKRVSGSINQESIFDF